MNKTKLKNALRNTPLMILCATVSIAVETFAWGSILQENQATVSILGQTVRLAWPEITMSTAFSLAALALSAAAADQKADPRPAERKRAFATQILAVLVLAAPVYYAGQCLALQRQNIEWREYHGSQAEAADKAIAMDPMADSHARADAAEALKRGIRPEHAEFDFPATLWIAFILGSNMSAVRLGWRAKPETPAEAKARQRKEATDKGRKTRAANKEGSNVEPFKRRA